MSNYSYKVLDDRFGVADVDLPTFSAVAGGEQVGFPAAAGDAIDGVVIRSVAAGESVRVVTEGRVPVRVSSASGVDKRSKLYAQTDGTFSGTGGTGQVPSAVALEAAANDGDVIQARISILIEE